MHTTKLVIRLLDAVGALMGWCEVQARVPGDGQLWAPGVIRIIPEVSGVPATLSTHWCDVNVETRVPWPSPDAVKAGVPITLCAGPQPLMKVGDPPVELPPVTVGRAVVCVPTGGLNPVGSGVKR